MNLRKHLYKLELYSWYNFNKKRRNRNTKLESLGNMYYYRAYVGDSLLQLSDKEGFVFECAIESSDYTGYVGIEAYAAKQIAYDVDNADEYKIIIDNCQLIMDCNYEAFRNRLTYNLVPDVSKGDSIEVQFISENLASSVSQIKISVLDRYEYVESFVRKC